MTALTSRRRRRLLERAARCGAERDRRQSGACARDDGVGRRGDAARPPQARVAGRRLARRDSDGERLKLAVGDVVLVEPDAARRRVGDLRDPAAPLATRAPRAWRRATASASSPRTSIRWSIVFAAAKPEPHPRMLDRFLVIAEANELAARIVINKVDLVERAPRRASASARYERAGYPVHFTSAKRGDGLDALRRRARRSRVRPHRTVRRRQVVAPQRALPRASSARRRDQRIGEQGPPHDGGRGMLPLPDDSGGYVVDTPGLREVGMWALSTEQLDEYFPEAAPLIPQLSFRRLHAHGRAGVRREGGRRSRGRQRRAIRQLSQAVDEEIVTAAQ